jgi:hypothetical protein
MFHADRPDRHDANVIGSHELVRALFESGQIVRGRAWND